MEAYQCNITVNLSLFLEINRSIVENNHSMLLKFDKNYAKQNK